jgi:hypothetical protein
VILSGTVESQVGSPGTLPEIDRGEAPQPAAPAAEPLAVPGEAAVTLPTAAASTTTGVSGAALPPAVTPPSN